MSVKVKFFGAIIILSLNHSSGLYAACCELPAMTMERNDNVEIKLEDFGGSESEARKLQYSGEIFQNNIKKILRAFDKLGTLD